MPRSDHQPLIDIKGFGGHHYQARIEGRLVGTATAWEDSSGKFCVLDVVVHPQFRGQGIATALYHQMELDAGRELAPALSLSDDGFEFWKRYRPSAIAHDLRHRRDELLGEKVAKRGRIATIVRVGQHNVTARYDDAVQSVNSETCISASQLDGARRAARRQPAPDDNFAP